MDNKRKPLIVVGIAAALAAVFFVGFAVGGIGKIAKQPVKQTKEESKLPETAVITKNDFDGGVVLSDNTGFSVLLDSNPTTGYQWDYAITGDNFVPYYQHMFAGKSVNDVVDADSADIKNYIEGNESTGAVGTGGTQGYMFEAVGSGSSSVTLTYHRPWEKDAEKVIVVSGTVDNGILTDIKVATADAADGMITVPNLTGFVKDDAVNIMEQLGIKTEIKEEFSETVAPGLVISQTPEAGQSIKLEDTVTLVVSKGAENAKQTQVPDILGKNPVEAEKALRDAGLVPDEGLVMNSPSVQAGLICKQSVEAGKSVAVGTVVTYNVSVGAGTVEMPNVIGMSKENAIATLESAGFKVNVDKAYSSTIPTGDVIYSSPNAGIKLEPGQTVDIIVSMGAEPGPQPEPTPIIKTTVPKLTGNSWVKALFAIQDAGLQIGKIEFDNQIVGAKPYSIIEQSIKENTEVEIGTKIDIKIFGENPDPEDEVTPSVTPEASVQ